MGKIPKTLPRAAGAAPQEQEQRQGRRHGPLWFPPSSLAGLYHEEDLSNTVYYCSFINLHEAAKLRRVVKAAAVSGA